MTRTALSTLAGPVKLGLAWSRLRPPGNLGKDALRMDASAPQHRWTNLLRWWVLGGLLVVLLVVGVQYTFKASDERSAFVRWRDQVLGLGRGEDIYKLYVYPNPPIMALILYPLAVLPEQNVANVSIDFGALSWFALKVVMTLCAFVWTVRIVQSKEWPFPPWAQVLLLLLALRPIVGDLSHGNVNLLILFLVVAALYAFRHGRDFFAGVILGLAIACKVTPALFVPYFLWKRAWTTLAGCAVGLALFLFLVPGLILGFDHNNRLLYSWYERMVQPYANGGEVTTEHSNQSLPGLLYRLTTNSPAFLDENDQPSEFYNVLNLEPWIARRILQGCGLAFLILLACTCRTPTQSREGWRMSAEYGVVLLGMLLFSERTWKHHCVTLLVPLAVLCYCLATHWTRPGWRWLLIGSLVLAELFMAATSTSLWEKLAGYRLGAKLAQVYGSYVWAYLVLLAALATLLVTQRLPVQRREDWLPRLLFGLRWRKRPCVKEMGSAS